MKTDTEKKSGLCNILNWQDNTNKPRVAWSLLLSMASSSDAN